MKIIGKCNQCGREIEESDACQKISYINNQEERETEFLCRSCYADKLIEELNSIRESAIFPNFSPCQFQRMDWIKKRVEDLGYDLV